MEIQLPHASLRRAIRLSSLMFAIGCLGALSFAANLIKDGSFETPKVPVASYELFATGDTFGKYWTVVGDPGNVAVISTTFESFGFTFDAHSGEQWLDLTGSSNTVTGVAQPVATTKGSAYTLTFWVGNVDDPGGPLGTTSTVNVLVNGTQVFSATNSLGEGETKQVWQKFTTTITASSSQTTIAFMNGDPSTDNTNGLDSVSLEPQAP
jgi:archaellum component FlaG (FlaF/FlaG flagellin family)